VGFAVGLVVGALVIRTLNRLTTCSTCRCRHAVCSASACRSNAFCLSILRPIDPDNPVALQRLRFKGCAPKVSLRITRTRTKRAYLDENDDYKCLYSPENTMLLINILIHPKRELESLFKISPSSLLHCARLLHFLLSLSLTTDPKRVWIPPANSGTRARAPLPSLRPLHVLLVHGEDSVCC
jgi:hypothetical protein